MPSLLGRSIVNATNHLRDCTGRRPDKHQSNLYRTIASEIEPKSVVSKPILKQDLVDWTILDGETVRCACLRLQEQNFVAQLEGGGDRSTAGFSS
jgi:hypothetical protein